MRYLRKLMRAIALSMSIVMLVTSMPISLAHAAMVTTDEVVEVLALADDRARVMDYLARADVTEQLKALGVDPEEAAHRAASLSDKELQQIANRLHDLPAGQDAVGAVAAAILIIFIVLLVTDIVGLTDVFPFVKSQKKST